MKNKNSHIPSMTFEIKKGDILFYGTDKIIVLDVHHDDGENKYYTIKFNNGREKQTTKEYLTKSEDKLLNLKKKTMSTYIGNNYQ